MYTRRQFLRRAAVGAAGAGAYGYARLVEPGWLDVVRRDLALPGLPDAFAGLTVAQLSDLHLGPYGTAADVAPAVDAVLGLAPDVIVLTGDFVSRATHGEPDMVEEALRRLRAPDGVYAVLGNHDWWENGPAVAAALRRADVTVLSNAHVHWRRGGQSLYLAGVDDVWEGRHDLAAATAGIPPTAAAILLAHEPDFADLAARDPRIVLQLSGHSHGGQVRVPWYGGLHFPPWARKYPEGQYRVGGLTLYTNRGLGVVGLPLRFCCRPEITLFTLRPEG